LKKRRLENLKKLQNEVVAEEFMIREYSKVSKIKQEKEDSQNLLNK